MSERQSVTATRAFIISIISMVAYQNGAHAQETLTVNLDALSGFSDTDKVKVNQAAETMSQVLSSEQFHQAVLNFSFGGKTQFNNNQLADAKGNTIAVNMTNEQIYDTLMASRETYLNNTDQAAHVDLTLYTPPWYKKWNVVGYGYPGQPQIFMNWYYFNSYTVAQIAANISHEWTHKLGFDHDYNRTPNRPYSVPYGVGCLVENIASGASTSTCVQ